MIILLVGTFVGAFVFGFGIGRDCFPRAQHTDRIGRLGEGRQ